MCNVNIITHSELWNTLLENDPMVLCIMMTPSQNNQLNEQNKTSNPNDVLKSQHSRKGLVIENQINLRLLEQNYNVSTSK